MWQRSGVKIPASLHEKLAPCAGRTPRLRLLLGLTCGIAAFEFFTLEIAHRSDLPGIADRESPAPILPSFTTGREQSPGGELFHIVQQSLADRTTASDSDALEALAGWVTAHFSGADIRRALDFLGHSQPSGAVIELQLAMIGAWAKQAPRDAAMAVAETDLHDGRLAVTALIGVWSEIALSDAIDWATGLPEGEIRTEALLAAGYEAARTAPEVAVRLAQMLPASREANALLVHAVAQWSAIDSSAAADWSQHATDASLKAQLQAAVAQAWADSDPLTALAFALSAMQTGSWQDVAVAGVAARWARQEPAEVMSLLDLFPPGDLHDATFENTLRLWASRDVRAVADWLSTLPAGPKRERSIGIFVGTFASLEPQLGLVSDGHNNR